MNQNYVLDSFALLCLLYAEDGADDVEEILRLAKTGEFEIYMSVINLGEVYYSLIHRQGIDKAQEALSLINNYPIQVIAADRLLTLEASIIKAVYPMAYADCFAAALAKRFQAIIVTGDPEFRRVEKEIEVRWLP